METETLRLRPPTPLDLAQLYELQIENELGARTRYRGATPSPEEFQRQVFQGVHCQHVVERKRDSRLLGVLVLSNLDSHNRAAYFSAVFDRSRVSSLTTILATLAFLNHCFESWDLRKIYSEVAAPNFDQFSSGAGKYFEVDAVLPEREYLLGKYQDVFMLSFSQDHTRALAQKFLPRFGRL